MSLDLTRFERPIDEENVRSRKASLDTKWLPVNLTAVRRRPIRTLVVQVLADDGLSPPPVGEDVRQGHDLALSQVALHGRGGSGASRRREELLVILVREIQLWALGCSRPEQRILYDGKTPFLMNCVCLK